MATAVQGTLQRLAGHRYIRLAGEFFHWWKTHLIAGLPPRLAKAFDGHSEPLYGRLADGEVLLWRGGDKQTEVGRFGLDDEPVVAQQRVAAAMARLEDDTPSVIFLVEAEQVLIHRLSLPLATEQNLRQVLAFEMDRHLPFTADQVYFDYRIVERREEERQIRIELVAAMRPVIDRISRGLSERGLVLHGIDVARERDGNVLAVMGVNLLAPELRARHSRRQLAVNLGLGLLFLVLLYGLMWQSLASKQGSIDAFAQRSARIQAEAREVAALRQELSEAREAASFLSTRKAEHPVVMNVLKAITSALPDEVWIQRLQVVEGRVQLTGQAPEAAALIAMLEGVECLSNPSPKGAFTPDSQSGKERFTIEVSVVCSGVANAPAATG